MADARTASLRTALVALAACSSDDTEVVWSGNYVEIVAHPEDGARLCAGTGPFLDASAAVIAARLGVDERVTYVWLPGRYDEAPCPSLSGGCTTHDAVYSPSTTSEHELVHAYAGSLGRADSVLEEGLAEYLGGSATTPAVGIASDFIGGGRRVHDPQFYPTAGRWVAEAATLTSLEPLLDMYAASDQGDPPSRFEALAVEHLGIEMTAVEASVRESPTCSALAYREDTAACAAEPIPWQDGTWRFEHVSACDDTRTIGSESRTLAIATFELDDGTRLKLSADFAGAVRVSPCSSGCASGDVIEVQAARSVQVDLPSGRYAVRADREGLGLLRVTAEVVNP